MFKFLRKYSVWILGFGGSLLLIAFLAPNVIQQLAQRAGSAGSKQATVGDGESVGYAQWQKNVSESQIIDRLGVSLPGIGSIEALPVGILVWVIGLSLGGTTGYAINPARDLGPRIVYQLIPRKNKISDWAYSWVPVLGPLCGGILAGLLFVFLNQYVFLNQ